MLFQVKTPKYNCPIGMYSETCMDEMVSGTSGLELVSTLLNICSNLFLHSESKLDPKGPAYQKMKNAKKFDPKRSSVLMVLNAQVEHKTYVELGRLLVPSLVEDLVVKAY